MAKTSAIITVLVSLLLGCEDAPPPILGPAVHNEAPSPSGTMPSPAGPVADEPELALNDSDFKEDEASRDPFRRLLGKPDRPPTPTDCEKGKLVQYLPGRAQAHRHRRWRRAADGHVQGTHHGHRDHGQAR